MSAPLLDLPRERLVTYPGDIVILEISSKEQTGRIPRITTKEMDIELCGTGF
jgi:hypothetical protein